MCRTAPDNPIVATCDRVKVRLARQKETEKFRRLPRSKIELCTVRPDFNRFFGAIEKDEQERKFRVHRELQRKAGQILT